MPKTCFVFAIALCITACSRYPADVEHALELAGDNRTELEQVLEHYRTRPVDNLKYRAACFLIGNMPGKYSEDPRGVEQYDSLASQCVRIIVNFKIAYEKFDSLVKHHHLSSMGTKVYDLHRISATYLINNIDQAFKVWEEQPWGKDIAFGEFCETILPYRVSTEPLEPWRDKVLEKYSVLYDSLKNSTGLGVLSASQYLCSRVDRYWRAQIPTVGLTAMSYSMVEKMRIGTCVEMTALGTFIMRGLGIPVSVDYTPQWPDRGHRHQWNSLFVPGVTKQLPFMITDAIPGEPYINDRKKAKVYRRQWQLLPKNAINPKDVSHEYFDGAQITLPLSNIPKDEKIICLTVFNNQEWRPVCYGKIKNSRALFDNMGKEILYLPTLNDQTPVGYPFRISKEGKMQFLVPDTSQTTQLTLYRKYPILSSWAARMKGGLFEGADNVSFKPSYLLGRIDHVPDLYFQTIVIDHPQKYRYIRYFAPEKSFGNIAELEFYRNDRQILGKPVGTPGASESLSFDKVFDGDVLTFFDTPAPDRPWVGMDFGHPVLIDKIRYLPRNDDNTIAIGQTYELFYWENNDWVSLGRQIPTEQVLHYDNVPGNALYLLRNLTKGVEERPFTYENGEQVWW